MSTRRRPRRVRSIVVHVLVFVLLGAVVNVAVAWGLGSQGTGEEQVVESTVDDRQFWLAAHEVDCRFVTVVGTSFGLHIRGSLEGPPSRVGNRAIILAQSGWPLFALAGESRGKQQGQIPAVTACEFESNPSLFIVGDAKSDDGIGFAPLTPIWPGFAINTFFYAAILWLLFAFPFALRRWRRVRRGLCAKCAYPVGTSDVCTECGAAVRRVG